MTILDDRETAILPVGTVLDALDETIAELGPAVLAALDADLSTEGAGPILGRLQAALHGLEQITDRVHQQSANRTAENGTYTLPGGWELVRTGGVPSGFKQIDRPRLQGVAAKRTVEKVLTARGGDLSDPVGLAEDAAMLALECVDSKWRNPGLKKLGLYIGDYAEESISAVKVTVTRTAPEASDV